MHITSWQFRHLTVSFLVECVLIEDDLEEMKVVLGETWCCTQYILFIRHSALGKSRAACVKEEPFGTVS